MKTITNLLKKFVMNYLNNNFRQTYNTFIK